jgi:hypothetical protein
MTVPTPDPGALLDRLEELAKAGTAGEWYERPGHLGPAMFSDAPGLPGVGHTYLPADAALIVAAVNALPDLLRLARDGLALRAEVERLAEEFDGATSPPVVSDFDRGLVAGYARAADQIRAVVADTSGEA